MRDEPEDVVLVHEAGLGVELHELELAVGPQVLVPQAAGDLVVAVDAAHHAELLEDLRALRQGVDRARLLAGRHHDVAGPLGRAGDEHGRLDLDEALVLHGTPNGRVDRGPDLEVALEPGTAQVDVPVAQAQHLVDVGPVVDRERRRLGPGEDRDLGCRHLDHSGGLGRVGGGLGAGAHGAGHLEDELGPQFVAAVHDDLDDAAAVPEIDEGQVLAVLAHAVDPAAQGGLGADVVGAQVAASDGPHRGRVVGGRAVGHGSLVRRVSIRSVRATLS